MLFYIGSSTGMGMVWWGGEEARSLSLQQNGLKNKAVKEMKEGMKQCTEPMELRGMDLGNNINIAFGDNIA